MLCGRKQGKPLLYFSNKTTWMENNKKMITYILLGDGPVKLDGSHHATEKELSLLEY